MAGTIDKVVKAISYGLSNWKIVLVEYGKPVILYGLIAFVLLMIALAPLVGGLIAGLMSYTAAGSNNFAVMLSGVMAGLAGALIIGLIVFLVLLYLSSMSQLHFFKVLEVVKAKKSHSVFSVFSKYLKAKETLTLFLTTIVFYIILAVVNVVLGFIPAIGGLLAFLWMIVIALVSPTYVASYLVYIAKGKAKGVGEALTKAYNLFKKNAVGFVVLTIAVAIAVVVIAVASMLIAAILGLIPILGGLLVLIWGIALSAFVTYFYYATIVDEVASKI